MRTLYKRAVVAVAGAVGASLMGLFIAAAGPLPAQAQSTVGTSTTGTGSTGTGTGTTGTGSTGTGTGTLVSITAPIDANSTGSSTGSMTW